MTPAARDPGPVLTLLTDFGWDDYYVGAVKGTLLRLAPGATLVDLAHALPAGAIASAAFLLDAAWRSFPPGTVHLAVVDPGVGSSRRILAAERESHYFVAPDNGLLTPILDRAAVRAVEREELYLAGPSETFHGRDRFAPVAAYLARGEPVEALGPAADDAVRLDRPAPRRGEGEIEGQVVHVDRFGNLVTDLPSGWLGEGGFEARVGPHRVSELGTHYAALTPGQPALVPGSAGTLEVSLADDDLARKWRVAVGEPVRIRLDSPAPGAGRERGP